MGLFKQPRSVLLSALQPQQRHDRSACRWAASLPAVLPSVTESAVTSRMSSTTWKAGPPPAASNFAERHRLWPEPLHSRAHHHAASSNAPVSRDGHPAQLSSVSDADALQSIASALRHAEPAAWPVGGTDGPARRIRSSSGSAVESERLQRIASQQSLGLAKLHVHGGAATAAHRCPCTAVVVHQRYA